MKRDFLEGLGLNKETIDSVMSEYGKSVEKHKANAAQLNSQLESLRAENENIKSLHQSDREMWEAEKSQIAYLEAVNKSLGDTKFTSRLAKEGIVAKFKEKRLDFENGELKGFDDYIKELKQSEPDAFIQEERKGLAAIDMGGRLEGGSVGDSFISSFRSAAGLKE